MFLSKHKKKKKRSSPREYYQLAPKSPAMEAYRVLRTNLDFSGVGKKIQTLLVTSSVMGEGKTTTVSNLGTVYADSGKKTVIVDLDMRKPTIHKLFGITAENGISSVLTGQVPLKDVIVKSDIENLYIVPCGFRPPNPSELLDSQKTHDTIKELCEEFDMVIIDSPPSIAITDAAIISTYVDSTLLVVSAGNVEYNEVSATLGNLKSVGANVVGVVMNNLKKKKKGGYYYYYYYYNY